jgi:hypothetical protein
MDWVLPTDEILARTEAAQPEEHSNAPPSSPAGGGIEHGLVSRLRKFAAHFKPAF